MNDCCTTETSSTASADLVGNKRAYFLLWRLPWVAIAGLTCVGICAFWWGPERLWGKYVGQSSRVTAAFDRFTDRARRVLERAQEEARRLKHNYVGTEHLLLGLVREGEGVAIAALKSLRGPTDLTMLRQRISQLLSME